MTGLRTAFTTAAGDTDLSTRLFGEEAGRGLDALQILGRRYDVVVTNPPYAGAGTEPVRRSEGVSGARVRSRARGDLYAAFILRCTSLAQDGVVGMVTLQGWMFRRPFLELRRASPRCVFDHRRCVALGAGAFEEIGGAVVNAAAFALDTDQSRDLTPLEASSPSLNSRQPPRSALPLRPPVVRQLARMPDAGGRSVYKTYRRTAPRMWLLPDLPAQAFSEPWGKERSASRAAEGWRVYGDSERYVRMRWGSAPAMAAAGHRPAVRRATAAGRETERPGASNRRLRTPQERWE